MHQTQWQEGIPHLYWFSGPPSGALPGPDGKCPCEESWLRLPPGLRALLGTLQNALQTDLAPLARTRQVAFVFILKLWLILYIYIYILLYILYLYIYIYESSKGFCHWMFVRKNASVEAEKYSQVSLTKALNLRLHPGEWLWPALMGCSRSGQLPGVIVWSSVNEKQVIFPFPYFPWINKVQMGK